MKEQIIKEIQTLSENLDKIPTLKEFRNFSNIPNVANKLYNYFTSYSDLILKSNVHLKSKPQKSKGNIKCNCNFCGKEIFKFKKEVEKGEVYCSRVCASLINNKSPKRDSNLKGKFILEKICKNCNNSYIITEKQSKDKECCSLICSMEYYNKNMLATNVIKRKGANSYDNIRKSARSYSKYKFKPICMNCGYDKHYEVCHIKDIKDFDHTISTVYDINNENNLIHLCPNCHWEFDYGTLKLETIKQTVYYLNSNL